MPTLQIRMSSRAKPRVRSLVGQTYLLGTDQMHEYLECRPEQAQALLGQLNELEGVKARLLEGQSPRMAFAG